MEHKGIQLNELIGHVNQFTSPSPAASHENILNLMADSFTVVDFLAKAFSQAEDIIAKISEYKTQLADKDNQEKQEINEEIHSLNKTLENFRLSQKHLYILAVEEILNLAKENNWGLCKHNEAVYLYNGCYWKIIEKGNFLLFIGKALLKMGVPEFTAKDHKFWELVYNQFMATGYVSEPPKSTSKVCVNFLNGTLEITSKGTNFRNFNPNDFLRYQLPYEFNPAAIMPKFQKFLDQILPDNDTQKLLSEYLGYIFIPHQILNLEKTLLLYGGGANGKSVIFNIVTALLGQDNISNYSLQNLTNETGYYRALLGDVLCNYASEISGNLQAATFKQLVSGEPLDARLPYGKPFVLKNYAKLIFNTNQLPKSVEFTNAYFRRFIIIPFQVTVPPDEQDPELAAKIIDSELPGILNWVLNGLSNLLKNKKFTTSELAEHMLKSYESESDSVSSFIRETNYVADPLAHYLLKDLYFEYRIFCSEDGYSPLNKRNFHSRLKFLGYNTNRLSKGIIVYITNSL
jgi:putative DNA primase/helicase